MVELHPLRLVPDKSNKSQMPEHPESKKKPGRPRAFDKRVHNPVRSVIERFNAWIKAFGFERLPEVYMGFVLWRASWSTLEQALGRVARGPNPTIFLIIKPFLPQTLGKRITECRLCDRMPP